MPRVAREPVAVAVCSSCGATEKDGALERWKKRCSGKQATKERKRKREETESEKEGERGESGILHSSAGLDGREYGYYRWDAF